MASGENKVKFVFIQSFLKAVFTGSWLKPLQKYTVNVRNPNIPFGKPNEIWFGFQTFEFQTFGPFLHSIIRLCYKCPKSERSVGQVKQPNIWKPNKMVRISDTVWNQNCLGMEQLWKALKSERSDFRQLLFAYEIDPFILLVEHNINRKFSIFCSVAVSALFREQLM